MKKILSILFISAFAFSPAIAAQKSVKYEAKQLQLQSQLKNSINAYEISFMNQGNVQ